MIRRANIVPVYGLTLVCEKAGPWSRAQNVHVIVHHYKVFGQTLDLVEPRVQDMIIVIWQVFYGDERPELDEFELCLVKVVANPRRSLKVILHYNDMLPYPWHVLYHRTNAVTQVLCISTLKRFGEAAPQPYGIDWEWWQREFIYRLVATECFENRTVWGLHVSYKTQSKKSDDSQLFIHTYIHPRTSTTNIIVS